MIKTPETIPTLVELDARFPRCKRFRYLDHSLDAENSDRTATLFSKSQMMAMQNPILHGGSLLRQDQEIRAQWGDLRATLCLTIDASTALPTWHAFLSPCDVHWRPRLLFRLPEPAKLFVLHQTLSLLDNVGAPIRHITLGPVYIHIRSTLTEHEIIQMHQQNAA
jgi:hypothetical protein